MEVAINERILCVDDELPILKSFQRSLRTEFQVETALSGEEGLAAIANQGPFAVVVSDLRMPGMGGIEFLSRVKVLAPDCVRIMLTGNADQRTAIDAVNEGNIFRFLTKPCSPEILSKALNAAVQYHRLIRAEKSLLEETLWGSVQVLTEVLSLVNPVAFGVAARVQGLVAQICANLKVENAWHVEVAAMLSQVGCVTVPEDILTRLHRGLSLSPEELAVLQSHPKIGYHLISRIPRMEPVADIIAYQEKRYNGSGPPHDEVRGEDVPLGARILKLALDFGKLIESGTSKTDALDEIQRRGDWYDPCCVEALKKTLPSQIEYETQTKKVGELTTGMILAKDVFSVMGSLMITKGQPVTHSLIVRLENLTKNEKKVVPDLIEVQVPIEAETKTAAPPSLPFQG